MEVTYPDEDEQPGVPDAVLALRDTNHGELHRARASLHEFPHLEQ